jgi:ribosomal protein S18 acetylase RimI-like enzyme
MDDLERITALEAECFPEAEAATKESFRQRLTYYPNHFYVLEDGDKLAGFVNGLVTDEPDLTDEMYSDAAMHNENGRWQMIFGLDTAPEYRQRGCGERLMRRIIEDTHAQGRQGLVLTCKERLTHYYEKFGFHDEGESTSQHGGAKWRQMRLLFYR